MSGLVRVDGKPFRVLGIDPKPVEAMAMTGLEVSPTRTTYTFEAGGVKLNLMFLSPLLPHDIAILSRPLTYVTYEVQAIDGKLHDVALYFDVTGEWAVNDPDQKVAWKAEKLVGPATNLNVLTIGMSEPKVLGRAGDDLRIEWGKLLVAAPGGPGKGHHGVATDTTSRTGFAETGEGPKTVDDRMPRPAKDQWPVLAHAINMGKVGPNPSSWTLMLAYDEEYAIEYFGRKLRPLWTRYQPTSAALLAAGYAEYTALERRCREFDQKLMADLTGVGGQEYARLCALAYRQCWAAHTLVEGPRGDAALDVQGEFLQRLHRHGGRDVPVVADVSAVQPRDAQGDVAAGAGLCEFRALEIPVRPARSGHVSARQRPGLRRRREGREKIRCRWKKAATC